MKAIKLFGCIMAFDRAGLERFFGELSSFLASCDRQEGTCVFISIEVRLTFGGDACCTTT